MLLVISEHRGGDSLLWIVPIAEVSERKHADRGSGRFH
jgi:hypothetical protein